MVVFLKLLYGHFPTIPLINCHSLLIITQSILMDLKYRLYIIINIIIYYKGTALSALIWYTIFTF